MRADGVHKQVEGLLERLRSGWALAGGRRNIRRTVDRHVDASNGDRKSSGKSNC